MTSDTLDLPPWIWLEFHQVLDEHGCPAPLAEWGERLTTHP